MVIALLSRPFWPNHILLFQSVRRRIRTADTLPLSVRAWPSLAPVIRIRQTAPTETLVIQPPSTRRGRQSMRAAFLDFLSQRSVQEPPAFGQVVERSLQFLHVFV